jgi:3-oxoacyl-[acyl-carrier-protein] synthase III
MRKINNIQIESISAVVPKNRVKNDSISHLFSSKDLRRFEKTTKIVERRHVIDDTTASDLGFIAAEKIISNLKSKEEVGTLLWLSQTSDFIIPFSSNILQDRLGLSNDTFCLDISAGCAGFVQGLYAAFSFAQNSDKKVLLVIGETLSKILSKNDRSTTPLFGDGSAAVLIGKSNYESNSFFSFGSDGSGFKSISIPDGGFRNPFNNKSNINSTDENGNSKNRLNLNMDGPAVFDFTMREIPVSISNFMKNLNVKTDDIDFFAFHQSNAFIIKQIANKLNIKSEKILMNISDFGNTSGVSIPLMLVTEKDKLINNSSKIIFSGYGSGLTWGNCLLKLSKEMNFFELIEI